MSFLAVFRVFFPDMSIAALEYRDFPVFLLVKKLTTNEKGADNLVICHTQTIEPLIRTFQSG
jgi:hypothetical protein